MIYKEISELVPEFDDDGCTKIMLCFYPDNGNVWMPTYTTVNGAWYAFDGLHEDWYQINGDEMTHFMDHPIPDYPV